MSSRTELQDLLEDLLGSDNVYFQPPPTLKMQYPCIVYNRDFIETDFADNAPYKNKKRYSVKVIDRDPDSQIHEKVAALPLCSYDRFYSNDNLNHDVFNLFF